MILRLPLPAFRSKLLHLPQVAIPVCQILITPQHRTFTRRDNGTRSMSIKSLIALSTIISAIGIQALNRSLDLPEQARQPARVNHIFIRDESGGDFVGVSIEREM